MSTEIKEKKQTGHEIMLYLLKSIPTLYKNPNKLTTTILI